MAELVKDADFEAKHPRAADGKFGEGGGAVQEHVVQDVYGRDVTVKDWPADWGKQAGTFVAYRGQGEGEGETARGLVFFSPDKETAEAYAGLRDNPVVGKYEVTVKNPAVFANQYDAFAALSGTLKQTLLNQRDRAKNQVDWHRALDKKLLPLLKKKGYDALVLTRPAAPALREMAIVPGAAEVKLVIDVKKSFQSLLFAQARRMELRKDADFEAKHPRDPHGRFGQGGGEIFASPNVAEGLKLSDAIGELGGFRQNRLTNDFAKVDDLLGLNGTIQQAIGAWADGAENSTVTGYNKPVTFDDLRASAAMRGAIADQKAVLAFRPGLGEHRMVSIAVAEKDIGKLHESLLVKGIEFHTLVPEKTGTAIKVLDQEKKLMAGIAAFAKEQNGKITTRKGTGEFVGDWGDRAKAQAVYGEIIRRYAERLGGGGRGGQILDGFRRLRDYGRAPALEEAVKKWLDTQARLVELAKAWEEAKHPRDAKGRFGEGGASQKDNPPMLPFMDPPPPQGKAGRAAGGFSATGQTNTMVGDLGEALLVGQLGMKSLLPPGHRQNPLDMAFDGTKWAFEVKTVTVESTEYKVKMKGHELTEKQDYAKANGFRPGTMILVMDAKAKAAYAYWRPGLGNFRLTSSGWNFAGRVQM